MIAPDLSSGTILAEKYRIERVLGRGGMGVVVAAEHLTLNQPVALKFLTPEACQQPHAVNRFLREARLAVRIQSEHVARIMDVGVLDGGAPYIVMELLEGEDLDRVLARGALRVQSAVDYVLQVCVAVAEAHALGIVHRDLKPANLFLTRRRDGSPLIKVLDFGISKALAGNDLASPTVTASAAVMGSPRYMAPEQIRDSAHVDARADVWALGAIMYQLLSGAPPYDADTVPALLAKIIADPFPPLRERVPDIHPRLSQLVSRCLEKDLERRARSVAEVARDLRPFASPDHQGLPHRIAGVLNVELPPPSPSPAPEPAAATEPERPVPPGTGASWSGEPAPARGGGRRQIAAVSLAAASLLGAVWFAVRPAGPGERNHVAAPSRGAPAPVSGPARAVAARPEPAGPGSPRPTPTSGAGGAAAPLGSPPGRPPPGEAARALGTPHDSEGPSGGEPVAASASPSSGKRPTSAAPSAPLPVDPASSTARAAPAKAPKKPGNKVARRGSRAAKRVQPGPPAAPAASEGARAQAAAPPASAAPKPAPRSPSQQDDLDLFDDTK